MVPWRFYILLAPSTSIMYSNWNLQLYLSLGAWYWVCHRGSGSYLIGGQSLPWCSSNSLPTKWWKDLSPHWGFQSIEIYATASTPPERPHKFALPGHNILQSQVQVGLQSWSLSICSIIITLLNLVICRFPPQEDVIDFVVSTARRYLKKQPKTLIVVGAYSIGKENVYLAISQALEVHCSSILNNNY